MSQKFKVSCPVCGYIVKITDMPGIQSKAFKCTNCGNVAKIGQCKFLGYVDQEAPKIAVKNVPKPKPFAEPGETIKIRCKCSQVLSFKYQPGAENAIITCPKCGNCDTVLNFEILSGQHVDKNPPVNPSPKTSHKLAVLRQQGNNKIFHLSVGKNVIGKKSPTSKATIQIETTTPRLSREHLIIDVNTDSADGYSYTTRLYKERVNATSIDGKALNFGQMVLLKHGMMISLPDVVVYFEIPK